MLRTILFLLLLYFLVKFISRLFMPAPGSNRSNASIFYQVFKNIQQQNRQDQQNRQHKAGRQQQQRTRSRFKDRLEEIEEAEYEDITDDNND